MTLKEYLKGRSISAFAVAIEVTPQAVYRYMSGERMPERPVMHKIVFATDGKVTANDFHDVPACPTNPPSDSPGTQASPAVVPGAPGDVS